MQKFVKLHSATNAVDEQSNLHPSQVKLAGYLKKKRTKVGGWRKLWFVLQNQLLLSYPSKEDYDRKLVSFKDVLNLVPGTVVRPLGGYRFAIQTTSESVYIFRCDDNKTYMDWITALVDSLSIGSSAAKKRNSIAGAQGGLRPKKPLHGSHSCSSLVRSKKNKPVHIPIAHGTARILNRTGLSENDLRAFSASGCTLYDASDRANYFCLHENQRLIQHQSNSVTRINRMFSGSASEAELSSTTRNRTGDVALAQQTADTAVTGFKQRFKCESDSEISRRSIFNQKMHELLGFMKTDNVKMIVDKVEDSEDRVGSDINANRSCEIRKSGAEEETSECGGVAHKSQSERTLPECVGDSMIEDQIQRLSLRGSSGFIIHPDQEVKYFRLNSTIQTEEGSPSQRRSRRPEQGCSGYSSASAGTNSLSERRSEASSNGDDSGISSEDAKRCTPDEPVYAVVDLKNKYEHRARLRHEMEERRRSQGSCLKTLDEVTTDYEEVFNFPCDDDKDHSTHGYDEENIYEPINIPESSYTNPKHRNVLWKYISRMNIDTLLEMARNRKKNSKSSEQTSPFANIRQKIGHHRKSIRIRMIKLYTRDQPAEEIVDSTDASEGKPDQA